MEENIHKIWGERRRILLSNQVEIDFLILLPNSFCSRHKHEYKINKFLLIEGEVNIRTEYGNTVLKNPGEHFSVLPPVKHRFEVRKPSKMIEIAYVIEGIIATDDIYREKQGGKWINIDSNNNPIEMTLDEMRDRGLLDLADERLI